MGKGTISKFFGGYGTSSLLGLYNYAMRLCILSVVSSLCNRMRVEMVIRSSNASADYLQPPLHFSALLKPYPSCIMMYGMNNMDMPMQERICCCNKILSPELQLFFFFFSIKVFAC